MKERQRWQPEEDALLRAYVKQYGAKEWNLVSQRMGKALDRDAKSCLERWKNYLKPGIKKGSLTEEEQSLVISLQAKYGNKWKKIAAEVPGRTAKRLGKWWEVFKEKQLKEKRKERPDFCSESAGTSGIGAESGGSTGKYDHILETFAEKYVQPKLCKEGNSAGNQISSRLMTVPTPPAPPLLSETASFLAAMPDPRLTLSETAPLLSLGVSKPDLMAVITSSSLPPWMSSNPQPSFVSDKDFFKQHPSVSSSCSISPSVSLSLSPSSATAEPVLSSGSASPDLLLKWVHKENAINGVVAHPLSALVQYCKELEEGRQNWFQHKKEATWRLSRLEQQLESEKARKRREKLEEIEAKIRCLREEEMAYLDKVEIDCREQLSSIQRDAELKEAKLMEQWSNKHLKLSKFVEQLGFHHFPDSLKNFNSKDFH